MKSWDICAHPERCDCICSTCTAMRRAAVLRLTTYRVELSRVVTQTAVVYVTAEPNLNAIQDAVSDLALPIDWQTAESGKEVIDINRTEVIG